MKDIVHFVPTYFIFFLGADGIHGSWNGLYRKFGIKFGPGAFIDTSKKDFLDKMPGYAGMIIPTSFTWEPEDDDGILESPDLESEDSSIYSEDFSD